MKLLTELCMLAVTNNVHEKVIGECLHMLPPRIKTALLHCLLEHDRLDQRCWRFVVRKEFFEDLLELVLPLSNSINDVLMRQVAASGCSLRRVALAVPMIPDDERLAILTGKGVSALLGTQPELEELTLIWCINFKAGVLNRVRSNKLRSVSIHGDAICSCFGNSGYVLRDEQVQLYQRDVSVLAINNPTINYLCLDSIILNLSDCHSLLSALGHVLTTLIIKVVRYYAYCEIVHCFYGAEFVSFLRLVDEKCLTLRHLSCYCYETDVQNRTVQLTNVPLESLALEGHVFRRPLQLPDSLRKLKLTLGGGESAGYFAALLPEKLPNLERLYVNLASSYQLTDEHGLLTMFGHLGAKIVSVTDILPDVFGQFVELLYQFCDNLKAIGFARTTAADHGSALLPLFQDKARAAKVKHLCLGVDNASQSLLMTMADNCCSLITLDVAHCFTVDDYILTKVAEKCAGLRTLDVSCCRISDEGLKAVAMHCRVLEEISLLSTNVGDDGLLSLMSNCTYLKVCQYDQCKVSAETSAKLKERCMNRLIGMRR